MPEVKAVRYDKHIYSFDLLRIVASFLVVINHTIGGVYFKFKPDAFDWYISALLFILCKTAVPLFFMITGSLLLQKGAQSYRKMIKYALRMLGVLIVWSYIYSCYINKGFLSADKMKEMLINIFTNKPVITPLWYLYTLIGAYIMLPFVSRMTLSFSEKDYLIFLGLWCLFNGLIPEINMLIINKIKFVSYFQYQLFTGCLGYFVLGYYLFTKNRQIIRDEKENGTATKKLLIKLVIILAAFSFGIFSVIYTGKPNVIDNAGFFIFIILSVLIYNAFIQAESKFKTTFDRGGILASVIKNVSEATFGIYLIHRLIKDILLNDLSFSPHINILMDCTGGILLFDVILYFLCFVIVWVARKIPVIRRIV